VSGPSIRLRLRVSPAAPSSELVGRYGEGWKVRVAAPAEDGRANQALVALLAETFDVPRASVEIVSGQGSRDKWVVVHGVSQSDGELRLAGTAGVA
jgi:uncharacterized protein